MKVDEMQRYLIFFTILLIFSPAQSKLGRVLAQSPASLPREALLAWERFAAERRKGTIAVQHELFEGGNVRKAVVKAQEEFLIYHRFGNIPETRSGDTVFVKGPNFCFLLGFPDDSSYEENPRYQLLNIIPATELSSDEALDNLANNAKLILLQNVFVSYLPAKEFINRFKILST